MNKIQGVRCLSLIYLALTLKVGPYATLTVEGILKAGHVKVCPS